VDKTPVTAIVVDYHAGAALVECVQSLLPQVAEVIVVDNGSQPATQAVLAQAGIDQAVTIICNRTNRGFAAACNQGIVAATTPYLLFFNPDAVMPADGVAHLLALLTSSPTIGMVGPKLIDAAGTEQWGGRRHFPSLTQAWRRFWRRDPPWPGGAHPHQPLPVPAISGAAMLVRRRAVAEVGLWDEGYFLHGEDLDWCWRFQRAGWEVWFEPRVVVRHAKGGCSRQRPLWVEWHKMRGIWRFMRRSTLTGRWVVLAPVVWLALLLWWLSQAVRLTRRSSGFAAR
jgi:hypothetical protein